MTISLCMIVRDEEPVLARCLESVQDLVEEIVVVDTGSRDNTRQIAARYAHKVLEFPWVDDFAAARNFAFDQGEGDYLFWLDGDDLLLEEDRERFRVLRRRMEEEAPTVVMLPYHTAFDRDGNPTFSYYRERLIRRDSGLRWKGRIHEAISPAGTILYGDAAVTHRKEGPGDPDRNLRIFEKMKEEGEPFGPREQFYYGRELYYHGRYEEAALELEAFFRPDPVRLPAGPGTPGRSGGRPPLQLLPGPAPGGNLLRSGQGVPGGGPAPPGGLLVRNGPLPPPGGAAGRLCAAGLLRVPAGHPALRLLGPAGGPAAVGLLERPGGGIQARRPHLPHQPGIFPQPPCPGAVAPVFQAAKKAGQCPAFWRV